MFALGIILFIIVIGFFPFEDAAVKTDYYYNLIITGNFSLYWSKFGKNNTTLSDEFKDMVVKMLSFNPKDRPNVEELKNLQNLRMFQGVC